MHKSIYNWLERDSDYIIDDRLASSLSDDDSQRRSSWLRVVLFSVDEVYTGSVWAQCGSFSYSCHVLNTQHDYLLREHWTCCSLFRITARNLSTTVPCLRYYVAIFFFNGSFVLKYFKFSIIAIIQPSINLKRSRDAFYPGRKNAFLQLYKYSAANHRTVNDSDNVGARIFCYRRLWAD